MSAYNERPTLPAIAEAIALFPAEFTLAAFPGIVCRFSRTSSYMGGAKNATVMLYTERQGVYANGEWSDFVKGTVEEFKQHVRPLKKETP